MRRLKADTDTKLANILVFSFDVKNIGLGIGTTGNMQEFSNTIGRELRALPHGDRMGVVGVAKDAYEPNRFRLSIGITEAEEDQEDASAIFEELKANFHQIYFNKTFADDARGGHLKPEDWTQNRLLHIVESSLSNAATT